MRRDREPGYCGPGYAGKPHRAAGKGDPVVHNAEDNYLEGKGCDNEIVVMGPQGRPGDQKGRKAGDYDPCRDVDPEGESGIQCQQCGSVCADAVKGRMCHGDKPGITGQQVQGHGDDGVDADHDENME